ncbi:Transcriptional regulatory protein YpdB [Salinivirga cyanobacteriivorans]|uniref:Transcriptional regulatory protein YpdB n=1 Tax=Salinivirga cyanobacteriivorans TaxID=1307839 RepID=A0A0S2HV73_9BACT|nr:LytTR family DNA-binding domain-containing protein [Salinivirga cyanobacteriivorans]ALO13953.1 Transcriptional regulatory protein YpdB [Salinivirga cyanobacteriivorans]
MHTKIVIIEDDSAALENAKSIIQEFFPGLELAGTADNPEAALELIKKVAPSIAIFDINLKKGNAFEIIEQLPEINFQIVWTTAYEQYAIQAFRISAVDFLLKPYKTSDLVKSIQKPEEKKISLHTNEALHIVNLNEIVYCKSEDNYTIFTIENSPPIMVSKPLKNYASLLKFDHFCRVHQSYLVNLSKIKQFKKGKNSYLVMQNKEKIPVSKGMRNQVVEYFNQLKHCILDQPHHINVERCQILIHSSAAHL